MIVVEALFVRSCLLVAVTVIIVFSVTEGAVKVPSLATLPPFTPLTDHFTSDAPFESLAVSCTVCVENTAMVAGVKDKLTAGSGEVEQPEIDKIKTTHDHRAGMVRVIALLF